MRKWVMWALVIAVLAVAPYQPRTKLPRGCNDRHPGARVMLCARGR